MSLVLGLISICYCCNAADSTVSISIAIPETSQLERALTYYNSNAHFHVILSNTSDKPQRFWQEWCSWGYFALSFEFKDEAGKSWTVKKTARDWSKNFPAYWLVPAHESLVLDVYYADTKIWEGFPRPKRMPQAYTVRAVFEVKADEESRQKSVWTGRVESKPEKIVFYQ